MKNKFKILVLILAIFSITSTSAGDNNNNNNNNNNNIKYKSVILDNSMNFEADFTSEGVVKMKWNAGKITSDNFKWYKIVRSKDVSNPVYPDHGHLKYYDNIDDTSYTDNYPKYGISYYRVCAIGKDKSRFCSNVVKLNADTEKYPSNPNYKKKEVYKEKAYKEKEYKTIKNNYELTNSQKQKYDKLIKKLTDKLEGKYGSDTDSIIDKIDIIIDKLNNLKTKSSKLKQAIYYINDLLEEYKDNMDSSIEDIFNSIN